MDNCSKDLLGPKTSFCSKLFYSQKYISRCKIQNAKMFLGIFSPKVKCFDFGDFEAIFLLFVASTLNPVFSKHFPTRALSNELALKLSLVPKSDAVCSERSRHKTIKSTTLILVTILKRCW